METNEGEKTHFRFRKIRQIAHIIFHKLIETKPNGITTEQPRMNFKECSHRSQLLEIHAYVILFTNIECEQKPGEGAKPT